MRAQSGSVHRFAVLNRQIDKLQAEIQRREALEREREQLIELEREARNAAEQASQLKDDLLAAVSHELRTPLHAIAGWALIRANPDDKERLQKGLDVIARNVAAETRLTEDLVDTSLIVSGRMKLAVEPVDLRKLFAGAVEDARPGGEAKGLDIHFLCREDDCTVNGDSERLLQVIANLLSNAIKYTPEGGRVEVELRRVQSHVECSIADTGEGIDPSVLPYVFDRFRRADGSTTRRHGGLGIGLGIVRGLVELHGGVVLAESGGLGQGSTFTVSLPLPAFRHTDAALPQFMPIVPGAAAALAGLHIVLVEDHDDSREMLASILTAQGATVDAVSSASAAYVALQARRVDAVISDIEMPGEDGFTLMRKWRDLERELDIELVPAVAVSAHRISGARLHALRSGFQAYLAKPLQPEELVATILSFCNRKRKADDATL